MLNKAIRKISRLYWERRKKHTAFKRRELSLSKYIEEINSEEQKVEFPQLLISIDDLSMTKDTWINYDRGGNENGIFEKITSLCNLHKWFRPIFFIIPHNLEILDGRNVFRSFSKNRSVLCQSNSTRIERILELINKDYIQIGMHGLHHKQYDCWGYHPYAEFEFSSELDDYKKLKSMIDIFTTIGLRTSLFKPPAFGIGSSLSKNFSSILGNIDGINYSFLSTPNNGLNTNCFNVSHIHETDLNGAKSIPQNVNLLWDYSDIEAVVRAIIAKNGIIHPQFHCVSHKCIEDGWSKSIYEKIIFIEDIMRNSKFGYKIWRPSE